MQKQNKFTKKQIYKNYKEMQKQTYIKINHKRSYKQTQKQTNNSLKRYTNKQMCVQANEHTYKQTYKQNINV